MSKIADTEYYLTSEGEARRHAWAIAFNHAVHFLELPCGYVGHYTVHKIAVDGRGGLHVGYGCANDPAYIAPFYVPAGMWYIPRRSAHGSPATQGGGA